MTKRMTLSMENLPRILKDAHGRTSPGQWEQGDMFAGESSGDVKTTSVLANFTTGPDAQFAVLAHEAVPRFIAVIEEIKKLHPTVYHDNNFVCSACSDDNGNKVLAPCDTMKTITQG